MAQDFTRYKNRQVGATPVSVFTANSNDALVGISLANITSSDITCDVYINDGSNDFYLVKTAPIPVGSELQLLDGGAKVVMQNNDILKVVSSAASSLDVWVSAVDAISA
jgi:hypothetical protein|tara:strand:- start:1125 stop:1451 length:327 start_codon:yes stop_codon:yes gene_type:complete